MDALGKDLPGQCVRSLSFLLLLVFHRRKRQKYTAFKEQVDDWVRTRPPQLRGEVEMMGKTMAEVIAESAGKEGEKLGEARGEARGEAHGLRPALEAMLCERLGPLEPEQEAALASADLDTLDGWFRRAVRAQRLEDIGLPAR